MAIDRTVGVRLKLFNGEYLAGIKAAGQSTKKFVGDLDDAARSGKKGMQELSQGAGVVGVAMIGMAAYAVKAFMDFDKQMSAVAAATGATGATLDALTASALAAGAATKFSALEAAQGQEALAKAGVSTADILGGALTGALDLAAAGELGVGQAAEIAATAMTQFGLKGAQVPHIADLLAAAAGKAQGEVADMGQALKFVGPLAHQMGISIEETTGSIAMLASNGILGSEAGTQLRGVLMSLTAPSGIAAREMQRLGINVYDAQGKFVGFDGVAGQLQSRLGGLTEANRNEALGRIFGNEQIVAARLLYAGGAQAVTDWTNKVNDSGYAAEQAARKTDNLAGDLERLKGSFETGLIKAGSGANGALRGMTQAADNVLGSFLRLPAPLQQTATWLTAGVGAALAAAGAYGALAPKLKVATDALDGMGAAGQKTHGVLAAVGKAAGVAAAVFTASSVAAEMFGRPVELTAGSVQRLARSLEDFARAGQTSGKTAEILGANLSTFGQDVEVLNGGFNGFMTGVGKAAEALSFGLVTSIQDSETRLSALDGALSQMVASGSMDAAAQAFNRLATEAGRHGVSMDELNAGLPMYREAVAAAGEAANGAAGPTGALAGQTAALNQAAIAAKAAIDQFKASVDAMNGGNIAADQSSIAFSAALVDLRAKLVASGGATSLVAGKAGDARLAFIGAAQAAVTNAAAMGTQANSAGVAQAALARTRVALINAAVAAGMSRAEAVRLADAYLRMPPVVTTRVNAPGLGGALGSANAYEHALNALDGRVVTTYVQTVVDDVPGLPNPNRSRAPRADGGIDFHTAADGYLPRNATIHRGPTLFQWSEPETGGEAFIPMGASKRSRSKAITEQVVGHFGGSVAWANGGFSGNVGASGGGPLTAQLAAEDRALLRSVAALAGRPIENHMTLRTDSKTLAYVVAEGQRQIDYQG